MNKEDTETKLQVPIWEKLNLSIEEASAYSNIGINKLYDMTNDPRCPFVLFIGKKRIIKRKAFENFIEKMNEI